MLAVIIPGSLIGFVSVNAVEEKVARELEALLASQAQEWRIIVEAHENNIVEQEATARQQALEIILSQAKIVYELIDKTLEDYRDNLQPFSRDDLIRRLSHHTVGRTGYIGILNYEGAYILSRNHSMDGENISDVTFDNVVYPVRDIIATGRSLGQAEVGFIEYSWANPGDPETRQKVAAILHFPEMEWIVAVTAYYDDIAFKDYRSDTVEKVKNMIARQEIGRSGGYIAIVDTEGHYIVSLNRLRDGEDISDLQDADGRYYVREGIALALEAGNDAETIRYFWLAPGTDAPREKIGGIVYYEPWNWIIWPNAYLDDFIDTSELVRWTIFIILTGSLLAGFIAFELSLRFGGEENR